MEDKLTVSANNPLVSILIPTYNEVDYFKIALESALNQTYKNIEIIVCDDSITDDIKNLMEEHYGEYKNITYINNGGPLGGKGVLNIQKCFEICNGEYVNFLLQDDLFKEDKIEKMIKYFLDFDTVTLVTSYRNLINENGDIMPDIPMTKPFLEKTSLIKGADLARYILKNMFNVVGELTTAMFRKSDIEDELQNYLGYSLRCNGDVAVWLKLLQKGDAVYIREPLSCFRRHSRQNSFDSMLMVWTYIDWYYCIVNSYKKDLFIDYESLLRVLKLWFNINLTKLYEADKFFFNEEPDEEEARRYLYGCFKEALEYLMKFKLK